MTIEELKKKAIKDLYKNYAPKWKRDLKKDATFVLPLDVVREVYTFQEITKYLETVIDAAYNLCQTNLDAEVEKLKVKDVKQFIGTACYFQRGNLLIVEDTKTERFDRAVNSGPIFTLIGYKNKYVLLTSNGVSAYSYPIKYTFILKTNK